MYIAYLNLDPDKVMDASAGMCLPKLYVRAPTIPARIKAGGDGTRKALESKEAMTITKSPTSAHLTPSHACLAS